MAANVSTNVSTLAVYESDWHALKLTLASTILSLRVALGLYWSKYIGRLFVVSHLPSFATLSMTIPVFRHNQDNDDWEVASVYDSDDCDSLGRSAYNESLYSSGSLTDPALHSQGLRYGDTRPRVGYPVPQLQHQNYPPAAYTRPQWDARYVPGKQSSFIVPPPGVIFPRKDWPSPPQETYRPCSPGRIVSSVDAGLVEPPTLLLSPSSPPRASSPLIRRPSPTTITHGQPPHGTSMTMSGSGAGTNVNMHTSPMMPPPPRYHELARPISPRLAEAGCQAPRSLSTVMSPPRRSGHDVFSSYAPVGPGRAASMPMPMPRGAQSRSSEEMTAVDGRYGGGQPGYGPGDRADLHPPAQMVPKYEREHEYDAAGRTRTARPQTRERRPSIWRRFVRRFNPSHVS